MGILRHGVHQQLEEEANALLRRDLESLPPSERGDILTPAKEALRRRREVLVKSGTPDPSVRQGIYGRAINRTQPHLNSRDGNSPPAKRMKSASVDGLRDFVERHVG